MTQEPAIPQEYLAFVRSRLAFGEDPNRICRAIEDAVEAEAKDWALFGDGRWRLDTVCAECGEWMAGICGHRETAGPPILRSEWERRQAIKKASPDTQAAGSEQEVQPLS